MSSIAQLKSDNDNVIRQKTLPNTITTDMDADLRDAVANELLARGVAKVSTTASLATLPNTNYVTAVVENVGIFKDSPTGPANGSTIFAGAGGRFWLLILEVGNSQIYTRDVITPVTDVVYSLADGQAILSIDIKPTNADTIRIGTTNGGDDIMLDQVFTAGEWGGVMMKIYTNGVAKNIYINGMTASTTINIYKLKLT